MDKKGIRSVQNSTQKSLATEQKKDVGNGDRKWSGGRGGSRGRRESSGCPSATKPAEPSRSKPRYNPQQNQQRYTSYSNKRPQSRGVLGPNAQALARTGLDPAHADQLDDNHHFEPEVGSVFVEGAKKQSLNHLLNFHYETGRERDSGRGYVGGSGGKGKDARWITTEKHKYNKEHYLQANCQFLVKADGDYSKYLNNPDTLVDWDLIEQINIQVNEIPSCPICLYPALAAKATRCGHVFCWPCILHYLALSDERWRKCPICYEAVHKEHLKSVVLIPHSLFPVNERITFTLMKRLKGSLNAYPVTQTLESNSSTSDTLQSNSQNCQKMQETLELNYESCQIVSPNSDTSATLDLNYQTSPTLQPPSDSLQSSSKSTQYLHTVSDLTANAAIQCKLVLATLHDVQGIIDRERKDLLQQKVDLVNVEVNPELCFVEEAIGLLDEREKEIKGEREVLEGSCVKEEVKWTRNEVERMERKEESAGQLQGVKTFYFYQASDGQHIYLHAINARMLEHTYGSLEYGPASVTGRILEKEAGSVTDQLRNRVRYLQHLPLTCQVEVAEIDLRQPDVSQETMDYFRGQLRSREKRRSQRHRSELKREQQIRAEENRQLGRFAIANLHLDSPNHFPTVGNVSAVLPTPAESCAMYEREQQLRESGNTAAAGRYRLDSERSGSSRSSSPSVAASSSYTSGGGGWFRVGSEEGEAEPGPSFAKMVSQSAPKKSPWPTLSSSSSKQPNPDLETSMSSTSRGQRRRDLSDSDLENDVDYIPAPAYNQSFSDAIAMALEKAAIKSDQIIEGGHQSSGKKKKKSKQKVLFATSMSFTEH